MIIKHSTGSYSIEFATIDKMLESLSLDDRVVIDEIVARLYPDVASQFEHAFIFPSGETHKTLEQVQQIIMWLASKGTRRGHRLIALGGGVVGDAAGFAAAIYMRGIPFVQVPTTLLAMVDSSVGGKVGVDLPEGKNLVGAFKPPTRVVVCTEFTQTLPAPDFASGTAEIIKMGFIAAPDLLRRLEEKPLTPTSDELGEVIETSIAQKAIIVEEDEFELTGQRATLNFGHTVGHAIESAMDYKDIRHGEAISIGMVIETRISERLNLVSEGYANKVAQLLQRHALPTAIPPKIDPDALVDLMKIDKKAVSDGISMSLLTGVGTCKLMHDLPIGVIREVLNEGH